MLRLRTFGGLQLERTEPEGAVVTTRPRRLALLAVVAAAGFRGVRRERILAILWPGSDVDKGRHSLSQTLYGLQREIGAEVIVATGNDLRLDPEQLTSDVQTFLEAIAGQRPEAAAKLYAGPFLDGFYLGEAAEFEQWAEETGARLRRDALTAMETAARAAEGVGSPDDALRWRRRITEVDPLSGRPALSYMNALVARGDRAAAVAHGLEHAALVRRELETEPDAEVLELLERLRAPAPKAPRPPAVAQVVPPVATTHAEPTIRPDRTRRARWAVVAVMLLVAGLAAVWWIRGRPSEAAGRQPVLAVAHFEDLTTADSVDLSGVITDMMATSLGRLSRLRLIANTRLLELMPRGGDTVPGARAAAARRAGAEQILEGELTAVANGTLHLELRRVDLESGEVRRGYRIEAADRFALVDSATVAVARDLDLAEPAGSLADVSTRSPIAYRVYVEGLRTLGDGDADAAYRLFRSAAAEDSGFAMAAYQAFRTALVADPGAAADLGDRALALAGRTTERDRLLIVTQVQAARLDPAALVAADSLASRYPNDPEALVRAAYAYGVATSDLSRAEPLLLRAIALDSAAGNPGAPPCRMCEALHELTERYLWADSFALAEGAARRAVRLRPAAAASWDQLARVLRHRGRFAEADAAGRTADSLAPLGPAVGRLDRRLRRLLLADDHPTLNRECTTALAVVDPIVQATARWLCTIGLRSQGRYREALALTYGQRSAIGMVPNDRIGRDRAHEAILDFEMERFALAARSWGDQAAATVREAPSGRTARQLAWYLTLRAAALAKIGDTAQIHRLADTVERVGALSLNGQDPKLHLYLRGLVTRQAGALEEAAGLIRRSIHSWTFGNTRANYELAGTLIALRRPAEALYPIQAALRGDVDGAALYVTRTELHHRLAEAHEQMGNRDSATAHYRIVARAWVNADPFLAARFRATQARLEP
ncbi:MAG: BTAD domain-containing putative transcriptional regulator [Gemmatimonadales bacterium]